jgi:hypothetical protein
MPHPPRRLRATIVGAGLLSLVGYRFGVPAVVSHGDRLFEAYVALSLALFGVYLLAVAAVTRRPSGDRIPVATILGFGLLLRLAVLPTPILLSPDPYRYLWDGRVQRSGINPYRHAPADEALRPLRDADVYPHINRPHEVTVYPPGAEAVFALVATVAPDSLLGWRLAVLACDVATEILVLGLLRRLHVPASAVLIYAWAPLAVVEGVQAGHVDFVMLPRGAREAVTIHLRTRAGGVWSCPPSQSAVWRPGRLRPRSSSPATPAASPTDSTPARRTHAAGDRPRRFPRRP